jgi:hypothetical protein
LDANVILVDRIGNVSVANGVLRVECTCAGPAGQERPAGTVLIPTLVAGQVIQSLLNALQELDKKAREAAAASSGAEYPTTIPTGNMTPR